MMLVHSNAGGKLSTVSDRDPDRQSIGTVILPVPGGIQDNQSGFVESR